MKIVSREAWGAQHDDGAGPAPLPAREVWLHHSAGSTPKDDRAAEVRAMRQLEQIGEQRFGRGVSYTFAVMPSGRVYQGHSVGRRGAHTKGRNGIARAVVLVGDYSKKAPNAAQVAAVADLLAYGQRQGWWTHARLTGGHRSAPGASTACPGDAAHAAIPFINGHHSKTFVGEPGPEITIPAPVEDDMPVLVRVNGEPTVYLTDFLHGKRSLDDKAEVDALKAAGVRDAGSVPATLLADVPALRG